MPFVLDCSTTMAWIFADEANEQTNELRASLLEETACVPALWPIEVANVLLVATRRDRIRETEWLQLLQALATLPIETDTETEERALSDSLRLALAHDLSVYDAVYLELALRRGLPLATLDRELATAAKAVGVEVLAFAT